MNTETPDLRARIEAHRAAVHLLMMPVERGGLPLQTLLLQDVTRTASTFDRADWMHHLGPEGPYAHVMAKGVDGVPLTAEIVVDAVFQQAKKHTGDLANAEDAAVLALGGSRPGVPQAYTSGAMAKTEAAMLAAAKVMASKAQALDEGGMIPRLSRAIANDQ